MSCISDYMNNWHSFWFAAFLFPSLICPSFLTRSTIPTSLQNTSVSAAISISSSPLCCIGRYSPRYLAVNKNAGATLFVCSQLCEEHCKICTSTVICDLVLVPRRNSFLHIGFPHLCYDAIGRARSKNLIIFSFFCHTSLFNCFSPSTSAPLNISISRDLFRIQQLQLIKRAQIWIVQSLLGFYSMLLLDNKG